MWKKTDLGKYLNKTNIAILFMVGLLVFIIALPTKKTSPKSESETLQSNTSEETNYRNTMENELEEILSKVQGVGKVEVLISLKSSEKQIVEKDTSSREDDMEQTTVYEEGTEGGQSPYVRQFTYPEVEGILVIADGGDNAIVEEEMKEAVKALFDIDTHKIKIMKRNS